MLFLQDFRIGRQRSSFDAVAAMIAAGRMVVASETVLFPDYCEWRVARST
jgi:hypothetical protein